MIKEDIKGTIFTALIVAGNKGWGWDYVVINHFYVVTLRRGRPREQLLLQNYKA